MKTVSLTDIRLAALSANNGMADENFPLKADQGIQQRDEIGVLMRIGSWVVQQPAEKTYHDGGPL